MYKRILLKLSGEALKGDNSTNEIIDFKTLQSTCDGIEMLYKKHIQIAIVCGAGNIFRGKIASTIGIDQLGADFMGMLGTNINSIAICESLKKRGIKSKVYSALPGITYEDTQIISDYNIDNVNKDLNDGFVCLLSGGTGKPFCSTDTASAQRAIQLHCDAILMAKNGVIGVYDSDPRINKNAKFLPNVTFQEMIDKNIQVMDQKAIDLIKDSNLEIEVFQMSNIDNFKKIANGEKVGTICKKGE